MPVGSYLYCFDYDFDQDVLDFCRDLKIKLGKGKFGFEQSRWRFNGLEAVDLIQDKFPDLTVAVNMYDDMQKFELETQQKALQEKKSMELKESMSINMKINGIKGEMYPYQKVGVAFFMNNNGKAILADQMGTGKTLQSLAYVVHTKKAKTIVVCPASVKYSWESEVKKWTKKKPFVIDSKTKLTPQVISDHDIFIINYDILKRFFKELAAYRFDCLICDEFHYIKNPRAMRTKLVRSIASNIESVLLLSGTPLLSRPIELFTGLNLMDPKEWNDYFAYTLKYCDAFKDRFGWNVKGSSNIPELQQKISRFFLRRTKDQVLPELPPKTHINLPVELDPEAKKKYSMAEKGFLTYLKEYKGISTDSATVLVQLNELRQLTSNGKIAAANEIIQGIIDSGEKIVVFSVYNAPIEELHEKHKDSSVIITGKTPNEDRKLAIEKFQNDPECKVFYGGLVSTGVGITLTAASNVMFMDYSWVPADHMQGEDRIHRPGQEAQHCTIYQLYTKGTIDDLMRAVLKRKQELFDELIDGKEVKEEGTVITEILDAYKDKADGKEELCTRCGGPVDSGTCIDQLEDDCVKANT